MINSVTNQSVSLSVPFVVRAGQQFTATTVGSSNDTGNNWSLNGIAQASCTKGTPMTDPSCVFTAPTTLGILAVRKTLGAITLSANVLVIP